MPKLTQFKISRCIAITAAIVFFVIVINQMKYSLGGLYSHSGDQFVDSWVKTQSISSLNQWQQALHYGERANGLSPNDPTNLRRLGLIYEWSRDIPGLNLAQKTEHYRNAKYYYQQVLRLRYSSGWDWLRLFRIKIKLAEIDAEAISAISNALYYGPSNYKMLIQLISTAVAASHDLAIEAKMEQAISMILLNGRNDHVAQLYDIFKYNYRKNSLCQLDTKLTTPPRLESFCSEL
jgi:tetratricopeptide (TPR) repeat protein